MIRTFFISSITLSIVLLAGVLLGDTVAFAQGSPLDGPPADPKGNFITCNGPECNFCNITELIERIIRWLVLVLTIIGVILFVFAGFLLSSSQGDVGKRKKAKDMILSVVIGFIVILSAWMIIDVIMKAFVGGDVGVWNSVTEECGNQREVGKAEKLTIESSQEEFEEPDFQDFNEPDNEFDGGAVGLGSTGGVSTGGPGGFDADGFISADSPFGPQGSGNMTSNAPVTPPQRAGEICYPATCLPGYSINTNVQPYNYPDGIGPRLFINVTEVGNPQISKHFRLCDLTRCEAGGRTGDFIYLDPRAVAGMDLVQEKLPSVRLQITSGYRSPAYNRAVGGAFRSQHMYGKAFDIVANNGLTISIIERACENSGSGWEKQYVSKNFTHCDWR